MSRKVRSIVAMLALTLFVASGTAHALPMSGTPERTSGVLTALWDWLASALEVKGGLSQVFEASQQPEPPSLPNSNSGQSDFGGFIDPNGNS